MDFFGFHEQEEEGVFRLAYFISDNFLGLAKLIKSDNVPSALFSRLEHLDIGKLGYSILYIPGKVTFIPEDSDQEEIIENVLIIDEMNLLSDIQQFLQYPEQFILCVWQMIFHELRHFVQCHVFNYSKELYLPDRIIEEIQLYNEEVASPIRSHLATYLDYYKEEPQKGEEYLAEVDAVIVSVMAVSYFLANYDSKKHYIDPNSVANFLIINNKNFEQERDIFFRSIILD